jgi:hypothetical protein
LVNAPGLTLITTMLASSQLVICGPPTPVRLTISGEEEGHCGCGVGVVHGGIPHGGACPLAEGAVTPRCYCSSYNTFIVTSIVFI